MTELLTNLTAEIYESAVFPDRWPTTLQRLCGVAGFWGGATAVSGGGADTWTITPNGGELFAAFATGGWMERNERMHRLVREGCLSFVGDFDIFTLQEWQQLPIYRDFLVPRGFGYGAATLIETPGSGQMAIILERMLNDGPTPQDSIRILDHLRPHLARALVLSSEVQRQRANDILAGLSAGSIPAALLREDCTIVAANREMEAMREQIAFGARDRISFVDPKAHSLLQRALSDRDAVRSIAIPSVADADAFVAHVIPLANSARDLSSLASALMIVAQAHAPSEAHFPVLKGLYDLTKAEARIAMAILEAKGLPEIARSLGIGYETVRSTAKIIYSKTGSAGQADLVRRLSALTRFRPAG
jgi:DNA-binding CsgD family transcriptional regulator